MIRQITVLAALVLLGGCASVADSLISAKKGSIVVPDSESICLVTPKDGEFEGKAHRDSGIRVANKVAGALASGKSPVVLLPQDEKDPVSACRASGHSFLMIPTILTYENRASGWTGKPDIIEIQIALSKIDNIGEESSFIYTADTNMGASAFFEWGNAAPVELLDSKFEQAVRALVAGN